MNNTLKAMALSSLFTMMGCSEIEIKTEYNIDSDTGLCTQQLKAPGDGKFASADTRIWVPCTDEVLKKVDSTDLATLKKNGIKPVKLSCH